MLGPRPIDFWTPTEGQPFSHLLPGHRYRVAQAFLDMEGEQHPEGETWTYLGHNFVAAEDELSLYVSLDDEQAWRITLIWHEDEHGAILDSFEDYVTKLEPTTA